jgi:hypothetical protein
VRVKSRAGHEVFYCPVGAQMESALTKHYHPELAGWHSEEEEARIQGVHIQTLRRKRPLGIGNLEFVKVNRRVLYRDGSAERLAERDLVAKLSGPAPRRRGRPRKAEVANVGAE